MVAFELTSRQKRLTTRSQRRGSSRTGTVARPLQPRWQCPCGSSSLQRMVRQFHHFLDVRNTWTVEAASATPQRSSEHTLHQTSGGESVPHKTARINDNPEPTRSSNQTELSCRIARLLPGRRGSLPDT